MINYKNGVHYSMSNEANNKGCGLAFFWIFMVSFLLPVVAMMSLDDTFERFLKKYGLLNLI